MEERSQLGREQPLRALQVMDELRLHRREMRLARDDVGREWLLELQPVKDRELLELVQMRLEASIFIN